MTTKPKVEIVLIEPGRTFHAAMLPMYFVTMTGDNGVWEETCYGEDQLRLCLEFFKAGVSLSGGGYVEMPEIPRS